MILAADNINTMNPVIAEAVRNLDPAPIRAMARRCSNAGAGLIDINPGYLSAKNIDRMAFMVETVQDVAAPQLILDSPDAAVLEKSISACRKKPILSAVTGEKKKLDTILPLAADAGADLVALLIDERAACPPSAEEKIALALEISERASASGLDPGKLIFDPVLPNISWPDFSRNLRESIRTVRLLSGGAVFGTPVRCIAGISNILSGRRKYHPAGMESACLSLLAGAGLEIALADALKPHIIETFNLIEDMVKDT